MQLFSNINHVYIILMIRHKYFEVSYLWYVLSTVRYGTHDTCSPMWAGGKIRPPFLCVSYEATKRVSQWQRIYGVGLYAGLLCNLYNLSWRDRDAGPKRCHYSPLNSFYTWCSILLTGLHHSPVVSIPLLLPSNFSIVLLHRPPLLISLMCTR